MSIQASTRILIGVIAALATIGESIASDESPLFLAPPKEASRYDLAYKLDIPDEPNFSNSVPYTIKDTTSVPGGFERIAYYMQLIDDNDEVQWVWVSMDAFTDDKSKIGVPTLNPEIVFQQDVDNLIVASSLQSIDGYRGIGNIEFWPYNSRPKNGNNVPGASDATYDIGDESTGGGNHGHMNVHATSLSSTILAFSNYNRGVVSEIGIGNSSGNHPDWTYSASGKNYPHKRIEVFVLANSSVSASSSKRPSIMPSTLHSTPPSVRPSVSASPSVMPSTLHSTPPSVRPSVSASPSVRPSVLRSSTPTMTPPGLNSWDISSTGGVTEEVISKDLILIKLPFNSTNRNIGALIFKKDCTSSFDVAEYPYFVADTSTPSSTHPDGYVQFNTTLELNVTSINRTQYWNTFTDGTRGGWVEACVETFLTFKDDINLGNNDSPEKVVFSNTVLNISVSLTATYEVDEVDIEREDAANDSISTDYSKFITAYQCGELDVYTKKATTYNQGENIIICVTDDSSGIVQVEKFVDLVVTQSGVSDYNYINNGMWNPDITTPVCVDASTSSNRKICYAKIRALARFFQSENPLDLTISGSVYVIRDGRRVLRKLHNALPAPENNNKKDGVDASERRSKEEENGSAGFGITVNLAPTGDSTVSGGTVESIVTGLTTMVLGAAGASLIV